MRTVKLGIVAASCVVLTGCLSSTTLLKVSANGSGTIEQTMLVRTSALEMMAGMGGSENAPSMDRMFSDEQFRTAAAGLGEGVRFVSAEHLQQGDMKGAKAVYAFDDITRLRLREGPQFPGLPGMAEAAREEPPFRFELSRSGGASVLTIRMPEPSKGEGGTPPEMPKEMPEQMPPEAMGMMKMMFQNLKVGVAVEVDGEIVRTNAQHREGSRVTIVEVDFNELMKDEASFKAIQGKIGPGATPADLRDTLQNLKGVKVNTDRVITIEWKEGPA